MWTTTILSCTIGVDFDNFYNFLKFLWMFFFVFCFLHFFILFPNLGRWGQGVTARAFMPLLATGKDIGIHQNPSMGRNALFQTKWGRCHPCSDPGEGCESLICGLWGCGGSRLWLARVSPGPHRLETQQWKKEKKKGKREKKGKFKFFKLQKLSTPPPSMPHEMVDFIISDIQPKLAKKSSLTKKSKDLWQNWKVWN